MNFKACLTLLSIVLLLAVGCTQKTEDITEMAAGIHERVLTVDTHVDSPHLLTNPDYDISKVNDFAKGGGQVDFPRMKMGGVDGICFATFLSQGERTQKDFEESIPKAMATFKLIKDAVNSHPDLAELATTPQDAYRIEQTGKRSVFLSIENGFSLGLDNSLIQKYYDEGVRVCGLSHARNNEICDSANDVPEHNGLSEAGRQVIAEMNRLGIVIDVSHISDKAFYDVIEVTKIPIVATHSSARALCDNPRNMTDEMLRKLTENGGVIQLCLLSGYIKEMEQDPQRLDALKALEEKYSGRMQSEEDQAKFMEERKEIDQTYPPKMATVADAVDHIDHIVEIAGIDHIGIGSDFDGGGGLADCWDSSEMGNITLELVKRGYSEEQIRKIWGGNFFRVMQQAQDYAANL